MLPVFAKVGKFVAANSSAILTGIGVVGVVATTILTYKATESTLDEIVQLRLAKEDEEPEAEEIKIEKADIFKACWRHWIPVALTVGITITSIVTANRISAAKLAAMASAYKMSEDARKNYKQAVLEKFGPNKEKDITQNAGLIEAKNALTKGDIPCDAVISTGCGDQPIYVSFLGTYIRSDMSSIQRQMAKYSSELRNQAFGEGSVYDILEAMHIPDNRIPSWLQHATWVVDSEKPETYEIDPVFDSMLLDDGTAVGVLILDPEKGNMPKFNLC